MPRYKQNFLDHVALEIRFEDISLKPLSQFKEDVREQFAIQKRVAGFEGSINVNFTNGEMSNTRKEKEVWKLTTSDTKKELQISQSAILLRYTKQSYKDSDELKKDTNEIIDKFLRNFKVGIINRIGLRYINLIPTRHKGESAKVEDLIDESLIAPYKSSKESGSQISRFFNQLYYKYEDSDLFFRSGIWNSDFPNTIADESYILDFDCFTTLPISQDEVNIPNIIASFNEHVEALFENSIKEKTREWMNK